MESEKLQSVYETCGELCRRIPDPRHGLTAVFQYLEPQAA